MNMQEIMKDLANILKKLMKLPKISMEKMIIKLLKFWFSYLQPMSQMISKKIIY